MGDENVNEITKHLLELHRIITGREKTATLEEIRENWTENFYQRAKYDPMIQKYGFLDEELNKRLKKEVESGELEIDELPDEAKIGNFANCGIGYDF